MKKKILIALIIVLMIIVIVLGANQIRLLMKVKKLEEPKVYTYLTEHMVNPYENGLDIVDTVYTFDENNLCIDCRKVWKFNDKNIAESQYSSWKNMFKNVTIQYDTDSTIISYTNINPDGPYYGSTKQYIIESLTSEYERLNVEYILTEY